MLGLSQTPAETGPVGTAGSREIFRDFAVGCLSIVGALVLGVSHVRQGGRLHEDYGVEPGPAMLPDLLLVSLAIIGLLLVLRGFLARRSLTELTVVDKFEIAVDPDSASAPIWSAGVLVVAILACLLYPYVGFGISAAALGVATCILLAYQENRSLPRAAIEGLMVAVLLYGVFGFILSVPLT